MNFSVVYKPDQASFISANIALMRSKLAFRIVAVVVLIMTIASVVSFFVFTKEHNKNISPIFLLVYVAIVGAVMYIRLRKRYTQYPALSQEKKYTFSDKGIQVKGASFEVNTDWSRISKVFLTKKFLFLFIDKTDALYIGKEVFTPSQLVTIEAKANRKA